MNRYDDVFSMCFFSLPLSFRGNSRPYFNTGNVRFKDKQPSIHEYFSNFMRRPIMTMFRWKRRRAKTEQSVQRAARKQRVQQGGEKCSNQEPFSYKACRVWQLEKSVHVIREQSLERLFGWIGSCNIKIIVILFKEHERNMQGIWKFNCRISSTLKGEIRWGRTVTTTVGEKSLGRRMKRKRTRNGSRWFMIVFCESLQWREWKSFLHCWERPRECFLSGNGC